MLAGQTGTHEHQQSLAQTYSGHLPTSIAQPESQYAYSRFGKSKTGAQLKGPLLTN